MTSKSVLIAACFFYCTITFAQQHQKLSIVQNSNHEMSIIVNATIHLHYGLSYPLTYETTIPSSSSELVAFRKYSAADAWSPLTEKTKEDFFNAEEVVRFDYPASLAYLSVAFGSATDSMYLKITNQMGENVPIQYHGISRYYDNRDAVVTVTADDWHPAFDQYFLYALPIFRKHRLWVSTAIVTEWCDAPTWQHIQTQIDSGNVEAMSHGRNHLYVPYPDPGYEVTGSKEDIINNLHLPALFRNGEREYVYVWVAPYGQYDDQIDSLVSENQYLVSRLVYFDERGFSTWEEDKKKYAPVGVTREMGPLWGGSNNLIDLNNAFNIAIAAGGIYHVMCHPHVLYTMGEWSKNYTRSHLAHISNRKNIWYTGMGHLYLYHFMQDETATPVSITATLGLQPSEFHLSQNYPNPFNPATRIDYNLSKPGHVRLRVYNMLGQVVETFVDEKQRAGAYKIQWNASGQPAGVYFYQLQVDEAVMNRRMLLLR
jgi:hypothetical protein